MRLLPTLAAALALAACASSSGPSHPNMADVVAEVRTVRGTGLRYLDLQDGAGAIAERGDCVHVHYTVYRSNGQWVESSRESVQGKAGEPAVFVLGSGKVIRGWDIGIAGMKVGGIRRLMVPEDLEYGAAGNPPRIPPHVNLVFDVQLTATTESRVGLCPSVSP